MYTVALMLAMTTGANAPDCYGGCYSYCGYGYGGCYSYGGFGYGTCYYGGYCTPYVYGGYVCSAPYYGGYVCGGYSGSYIKDPSEDDEEFNFCQREGAGMSASEYSDFRGKWLKMTHPDRKKMMDKKGKGKGISEETSSTARVIVTLPADAKLAIEGVATTTDGTRREFVSPPLSRKHKYSYTLKAEFVREGKTVRLTKKAIVSAGKETLVSFDDATARIVVTLPADAKLTIDDTATRPGGTRREFVSPPLAQDHTYSYTLKAEFVRKGKTVRLTKKAVVSAGKETLVSFAAVPERRLARK